MFGGKLQGFFFLRNDVIQIQFKDRKRRDWSEQRQSEDISRQPTADGQDLKRVSSEDCNRDFSRQSRLQREHFCYIFQPTRVGMSGVSERPCEWSK